MTCPTRSTCPPFIKILKYFLTTCHACAKGGQSKPQLLWPQTYGLCEPFPTTKKCKVLQSAALTFQGIKQGRPTWRGTPCSPAARVCVFAMLWGGRQWCGWQACHSWLHPHQARYLAQSALVWGRALCRFAQPWVCHTKVQRARHSPCELFCFKLKFCLHTLAIDWSEPWCTSDVQCESL